MRYAYENNMTLVSFGSTAPSLATPNDNAFRFVPDDTHAVEGVTQLMDEDGVSVVVPLCEMMCGATTTSQHCGRMLKSMAG